MAIVQNVSYKDVFTTEGRRLIRHYDAETVWIEPWGKDSLRVRATKRNRMEDQNWALLDPAPCDAEIRISEHEAEIQNGRIRAVMTDAGKIFFYNDSGRL
ncbi:MAG: family 31 glucosidase, partial [Lachnospiraceae bacterium]|nr:family 31 glucosidase [Lachnospiraceae bacterium]